MGNIDKAKTALKQNKKYLVVIIVLWIIIAIVLVAPVAVALEDTISTEESNLFQNLAKEITSFTSFFRMFTKGSYIVMYLKIFIVYAILCTYWTYKGYSKTSIKGKYHDIEHGSSDWSKNGEQYKILSKDKGLILAKDNCLPLDKRGNINTLIVGGSGSGKSTGYSFPNAYQMLGSYVFTDPKGEIYDQTAG